MRNNSKDEIEIDLLALLRALLRHVWVVITATVVCGAIALSYTAFLVTPMYTASTLLYVNNSSISVGSTKVNISAADLTAAQSLVDTYIVILKSRTTLEEIIEETGVNYTYEELKDMISSGAVNNTEIFNVDVTGPDPEETELIANTIAKVLPKQIASIVDGSSVRIVDHAVVPTRKSSPSLTKNTAMGMILGFVLSCGIIVVMELFDTLIKDEEYLIQTYDLPLLAVIPDLQGGGSGNGYYGNGYYGKGYYGKGYYGRESREKGNQKDRRGKHGFEKTSKDQTK